MTHRVFISYSGRDSEKAEKIRAALEDADIRCWIAPRDIAPGQQWGGSIVAAIESSKAVLVVFSQHANDSPQIAREMEVAVAKRVPLIPVRIADAMPSGDMQYFLGVSHWLNAYPKPLGTYLSDIVAAVQRVLSRNESTWHTIRARLPQGRNGRIALGAAGAVLVALVTAWAMRPSTPDYMEQFRSPLTGRWQTSMAGADGRVQDCILDVQEMGQAAFSDTCPMPFTGAHGSFNVANAGTWAPQIYQQGDDGTMLFQGGTLHGYSAAFRKTTFGNLVTRDAQHGEINWSKASNAEAVPDASRDIIPAGTGWPVKDVPGIARRSTEYVRSHWQKDAVLMAVQAKLTQGASGNAGNIQTPDGAVELSFQYYSPATQQGLQFTPNAAYGGIFPQGAIDRDPARALPDNFLDLPDAVANLRQRGMRGLLIVNAQLENWASGTSYGSVSLNGLQWMIDSALDERATVPASVLQ